MKKKKRKPLTAEQKRRFEFEYDRLLENLQKIRLMSKVRIQMDPPKGAK